MFRILGSIVVLMNTLAARATVEKRKQTPDTTRL
jgi:hypothetical protein